MKWEALPLADRAKLMAAAVRNGYTDIRSIKEAYANYLNLKLSTGNRYAKGGDTDEPEVVNLLDNLPIWKALENIDYKVIADPDFTRDKTGSGSIEYFDKKSPGILYNNGYYREHPLPGRNVILYNPNDNDAQDVRLDLLHAMPDDATYDALNELYRRAAGYGDIMHAAQARFREDVKKEGIIPVLRSGMFPDQYFLNEADGLLRNMFIEGSDDYIANKRYWPNKEELRQWNSDVMPYIDDILHYLETGKRPPLILPELIVTNQNAYGGNLFQKGGNKNSKKKSWLQELQERRNYYRQQLILRGLRGAQLEAVLANMEVESKFDPGAHNDASGARGLMQWLGSRKPKSWSEKDQLDYIAATYNKFGGNEWLDKAAWKRFNETTDPAEAARLFRRYWERPEKSSWYATDALFKDNGSYLPKEVNDVVKKVASLEYNGPREFKGPIFTDADQRLLDTPLLAFHNPQYDDYESPDYQESPLMLSIKLNLAYDDSDNPFALYNMLASLQQESAQNNPYSWLSALMTVSPKTAPEQKQTANWLFAPQEDDYMYHGLNFAAYGGPLIKTVNNHLLPFGGYTNAINAINQTGEGYHYIIDGQTMNRQQALDYINKHKNEIYAVNRYSTTSSTANKQNQELNWQTLDANGKWIDNNEYHPDEGLLDEVVITHPYTVNNALSQDRTYLQHNPIADLTITPTIDLTNTDQNMFHRRDVANADASVRESMSSDVVDNIYDYMMPSTWAGLADKALEGGYNFNQLFNPTYDNQGWVGLFGADEWAKEHPEEAFAINFGADLVLPFGTKGIKTITPMAANATKRGLINSTAKTAFLFPSKNAAARTAEIFRQNDWANFLQTVNGNNYYRLENSIRKIPYGTDQDYFLSHSMPWAEFTGPHLIEHNPLSGGADRFFGTKAAPYKLYKLYEFPNGTFGDLMAVNSKGIVSDIPVSQMGYNQLHFGNNATRQMGWTNAGRYPGETNSWGNIDRPLTYNRFGEGLYDASPSYSNIHQGNQTVVKGKDLTDAIRTSGYNTYELTPHGVQRTWYGPQTIQDTRWMASDMANPETSDIAKSAAQRIAGDKNATFNTRREYDLMYRGDEYNAAIHEGRYPAEDGTIPEIYRKVVQSEAEDAIQRMANMGIKEHGVLLDDVASLMRNNAGKTEINLVTRKNSSPTFDDPNTVAATTPNVRNYSSNWIIGDTEAYPATVEIPLFDARERYSNILPPIREVRIPINNTGSRGVMGIDNLWRLNDPYFGKRLWDFDLVRLTSNYWDDIQHEMQHAVGQDMIDLSVTHQPKYNGIFDSEGNLLYKVLNPNYPMGLVEKNFDMGDVNWGKNIGGKAAEVDAEQHAMIAAEQFLNPEQNITNWNSLYDYLKDGIVNRLSNMFKIPKADIRGIIDNILAMRKALGY